VNNAQAKNVYWVVAGNTALGANSTFNGNILDKTDIALKDGATLNGRALSQTEVALIGDTVNGPTAATYVPTSSSGSGTVTTDAIASGTPVTLDFSASAGTTIDVTTNNTVDAGTPVTVTAYTSPPITGMSLPTFTPVGRYITITAQGLEANVSSVIINMQYDPAALPTGVTEANLVIEYYNVATQSWESLPSTVDTVNHIVSATSTHLSTYGLFASPATVDLKTAGNFVILSKTGITTTPGTQNTLITGDIGVSPIDSASMTGFNLTIDSSSKFSTSSLVVGKVYAANYADPTPATLTTAVSDMEAAYTAANLQTAGVTNLGAGSIDGLTLTPGVYSWTTDVSIPNSVTLDAQGDSNAIWVSQIAGVLSSGANSHVILANGAQAKNVYWVVAGNTALGANSEFNGNILDQTYIALGSDATLNGRTLAQTAVTLIGDTVTVPTPTPSTPVATVAAYVAGPDNGGSGDAVSSSSGSGSSSGSSGASLQPSNQLAPVQVPAVSATAGSATAAPGQLAPTQATQAPVASATTTKASAASLPLIGIAGVIALVLFTRRNT
jgi:hypothetical protein